MTAFDVYLLKEPLEKFNTEIFVPEADGYEEIIQRWSDAAVKRAGAVVLPATAEEVSVVVNFARDNKIPFVVACGRHSTGAASSVDDGVVIDLRKMRNVTVDTGAKTITAGGGCIWEDVDVAGAKYGLATPGGTVNHTGIGGLTLGGGYGWLSGRYGMTVDNLVSAKMVLANGDIVTASETENSDLFWAIRGCGSSFGVAVEFTYQAFDQGPVWAGILVFTPDKLVDVVKFANKLDKENSGDQALFIGFSAPPPMNQPAVLTPVFYNGPEVDAEKFFADLLAIGPVVKQVAEIPYEKLNGTLNGGAGYGGRKSGGGSAAKFPLDPAWVQSIFDDFVQFLQGHEGVNESHLMFELIPYKKIAEIPLEATSNGNRGEYYNVSSIMKWYDPTLDKTMRSYSRSLHQKIREGAGPTATKGVGAYANYVDYPSVPEKIFGANTPRLIELKKKYDPQNLFFRWHNLLPDGPVA